MIFWTSFLVFLASIMIYLLLPARTDQIALDHYRDDPLVVSFVNQHQAAKNYIDQMIMWKTSDELETSPIHPLYKEDENEKLVKFMPKGMQTGDGTASVFHDIGMQADVADDVFVSGMICLDPSKALAECTATNNSYIITYGYVPSWWDITNMGRQGYWEGTDKKDESVIVIEHLWLKPMLRRTHGTTLCGRLLFPTDEGNPAEAYMIDNGQEYGGFDPKTVDGQTYKTIPSSIGDRLRILLPKGPLETTQKGRRHVMVCMTPYQNAYVQEPIFQWDYSNNQDGHGHQAVAAGNFGTPLIGSLSEKTIQWSGETPTNYTLNGTVKKGWMQDETLMNLDATLSPKSVKIIKCLNSDTCGSSENLGKMGLSIGDTVWAPLPDDAKPFSFTYEGNESRQKLTVSYTKCHISDCEGDAATCPKRCALNTMTWVSSDTAAPTLSEVSLENINLVDITIYNRPLSDGEVAQNNKVNHRRFGI